MITSKLSRNDKDMLRGEFKKVWGDDSKMVEYCTNKTSAFMTIDSHIITIDKPSIRTHFCFGYGVQGAYDYDEAQTTCSKMSGSERYFIDQNLKDCLAGQILENLSDSYWVDFWLVDKRYGVDCNLSTIRCERREDRDYYMGQGWRLLTKDELTEYKQMLETELEKFLKRLKTYLKRYGLSKCDYWTYWVDE